MDDELSRTFRYANDFFLKRLGLIIIFSIPFIIAILIPALAPAPTYLALGGVFLRTGSIPELSLANIVITAIAYVISIFVISDTIVNVNIIVRSKRTSTTIKHEVLNAIGSYAARIFYIYTMVLLLLFIVQLLTYDNSFQSWIYALVTLVLGFLLFFVPPAVVIDNSDTPTAIKRSVDMAIKNPQYILLLMLIALFLLSLTTVVADLIFSYPFSLYFVLLINSLLILPYMIVLQTQMYMEKYPLAR